MDPRLLDIAVQASLKAAEEQLNNNIITGVKTARKTIEYLENDKKGVKDVQLVDYKVQLLGEDDAKDRKKVRAQYDSLKALGLDPIKQLKIKEEELRLEKEAHNGR